MSSGGGGSSGSGEVDVSDIIAQVKRDGSARGNWRIEKRKALLHAGFNVRLDGDAYEAKDNKIFFDLIDPVIAANQGVPAAQQQWDLIVPEKVPSIVRSCYRRQGYRLHQRELHPKGSPTQEFGVHIVPEFD